MVATVGPGWYLAPCLAVLAQNADAYAPGRGRGADGSIGDAAHRAQGTPSYDHATGFPTGRGTDHEPDDTGCVCALDLTHDPGGGFDAWEVGHRLAGDHRLAYLELENVAVGRKWEWSIHHGWADVGPSSAGRHLHISVLHLASAEHDTAAWTVGSTPPPPPPEPPQEDEMLMVQGSGPAVLLVGGDLSHVAVASPADVKVLAAAGVKLAAPLSDEMFNRLASLVK